MIPERSYHENAPRCQLDACFPTDSCIPTAAVAHPQDSDGEGDPRAEGANQPTAGQ